jgi:MFS family permease
VAGPSPPRANRGTLVFLAVPTLGFALAATTVGTYLPVVLAGQTSSATAIGALIAVEGVLTLFLPVLAGSRSDRISTRLGGRLPFVLAGTALMALGLCIVGFVNTPTAALGIVIVLYAGYSIAYEPYRAIYPDLVSGRDAGRSQSAQAVARGVGTALALIGGGLLLAIADPVPFLVAAGVLLTTTGAFTYALARDPARMARQVHEAMPPQRAFRVLLGILRARPAMRAFVAANALWEAALAAVRTFVVLWVTVGLGLSLPQTAGVIGLAGVVALIGAGVAGRLAEQFGIHRVLRVSALTYGLPMVVPLFSHDAALLLVMILPIAASAGIMMALPYALLFPMMPVGEHGLLTGLFGMSRGIGIIAGPLLAGAAIQGQRALGDPLGTEDYSAVWLVAGVFLVLSVPLVEYIRRAEPPGGGE